MGSAVVHSYFINSVHSYLDIHKCLIFKLGRQTQDAVLRRINGLERKMGAQAFREKFKSITLDNGSEFLHWEKLEQSVL